ncbi:hypothetical protein PM082_024726 [Marasmius tenuissimus]|nr:hypothetical protein PM082_024726 [Marasmius tenuissimus]
MPENPELDLKGQYVNRQIDVLSLSSYKLRTFFADVTKEETKSPFCPPAARLPTGHVTELTLRRVIDMDMTRGNPSDSNYILPVSPNILNLPYSGGDNDLRETRAAWEQLDIRIERAVYHTRWVVLQFRMQESDRLLYLGVQPLLHMSVNIYERDVWRKHIRTASRQREVEDGFEIGRRFKIALAIDFTNYVLVFGSSDNLFGIKWSLDTPPVEVEPLPHIGPAGEGLGTTEVYFRFLQSVVVWVSEVLSGTVKGCRLEDIICLVLRNARGPWNGIGVYTVCELLWYSGISPWLTLRDVITNPSRLARLCEGMYAFMYDSHVYNRRILKRVLVKSRSITTLSATLNDILDYPKTHLIVYGRTDVKVSTWVRDRIHNKEGFDVYEYDLTYSDTDGHLAYMIWETQDPESLSSHTDPLAVYFLARMSQPEGGIKKYFRPKGTAYNSRPTTTHLPQRPLDTNKRKVRSHSIPTLLYRAGDHSLWTPVANSTYFVPDQAGDAKTANKAPKVIPMPKPMKQAPRKRKRTLVAAESAPEKVEERGKGNEKHLLAPEIGEERRKRLISHVKCRTKGWTVGPLDFCGVAKAIRNGIKHYIMYSNSSSWSPTAQKIYRYREGLRYYEGNRKQSRLGTLKALLDTRRKEIRRKRNLLCRHRFHAKPVPVVEAKPITEEGSRKRKRARRVYADKVIASTAELMSSSRLRPRIIK